MEGQGRIGPNAILQLVDVLERQGRTDLCAAVLAEAGVSRPPPDAAMLPESDCAAVHQSLRRLCPERAEEILRDAGLATGDYILAHRIPRLAQAGLKLLPGRLASRALSGAIARHAWTFAGTGAFGLARRAPLTFVLRANPLVAGLQADSPQCVWHAAVFERLFATLVWPRVVVTETACCACGDAACRFELVSG
jgi:divinyl protochlorophyllide a 8-vinyl-reductase